MSISLLIWTRAITAVTLDDAFVPAGCEASAAPLPAVGIGVEGAVRGDRHLHLFGAGMLPPRNTEIAQWMLRDMNFFELGKNEAYLLEYAVPRVLRYLAGTIQGEIKGSATPDPKRRDELVNGVSWARRVLVSGLEQLHALQDQLKSRA